MNEEKREKFRVVFDTNVLLSALLWHQGKPRLIFRKAIEGKIKVYCCKEIIQELRGVLKRDFDESNDLINEQISVILAYMEFIEVIYHEKIVKDDPDDDLVINCALSARANYIVSGDAHLLKIKEYNGIKILSPAEFIRLFE